MVAQVQESGQPDQLSYHSGQDPGVWVGSPQHLPHLEPVKGPVLQNLSCRISITQEDNRLSGKGPGEDPVLIPALDSSRSPWLFFSLSIKTLTTLQRGHVGNVFIVAP